MFDDSFHFHDAFGCSLLETQTRVAQEREQREQHVMATLEMMSLFKLHVQQVTAMQRAFQFHSLSLLVLQSLNDVQKRFEEIHEEIEQ